LTKTYQNYPAVQAEIVCLTGILHEKLMENIHFSVSKLLSYGDGLLK